MYSVAEAANAFLMIFNELPVTIRALVYLSLGLFAIFAIVRGLLNL